MNNVVDGYFETVASLTVPRANHSATVLPDGSVLVVGGINGSERNTPDAADHPNLSPPVRADQISWEQLRVAAIAPVADVERYDSLEDTWHPTSPLAEARSRHCAVRLINGQVMIIAGAGQQRTLNSVELYNSTDDCWTAATPLGTPRFAHTATLLNNGHVLVCAGNNQYQGTGQVLDSVEIYDPANDSWTVAPWIPIARMDHSATLLASGEVLVLGGTRQR